LHAFSVFSKVMETISHIEKRGDKDEEEDGDGDGDKPSVWL